MCFKHNAVKKLLTLLIIGAAVGGIIAFFKKFEKEDDDDDFNSFQVPTGHEYDSNPETERSYTTIVGNPKESLQDDGAKVNSSDSIPEDQSPTTAPLDEKNR